MKMKRVLSLILTVLLAFSCCAVAFAQPSEKAGFGEYEHVFIIGVDGLGAALEKVESPNFDRIFGDNAYRHDAHTEVVTVSAQNWGSILTGVSYDVHGFENGWCSKNERDSTSDNNSIFYYVRQAYPDAELVSFNHWSAINHGIIENDLGVRKINRFTDTLVVDMIVRYFNKGNAPKLMFVQLDAVDHAAHSHGGFSDEYFKAAAKADVQLGEIYDAIEKAGLMEKGLFILVADHGETDGGHGGQTKEESSAILAVAGHSVNKTILNETVQNRDVSAIALHALGIEQPEHMISVVPPELFGESRAKTVAPNPNRTGGFGRPFVRAFNWILCLFDKK